MDYLKDICNFNTFNLLTSEEKDSLLKDLSYLDRQSESSIQAMFQSDQFRSYLTLFQTMLIAGEFDTGSDDYKQYLRGKRQRQLQTDPVKVRWTI